MASLPATDSVRMRCDVDDADLDGGGLRGDGGREGRDQGDGGEGSSGETAIHRLDSLAKVVTVQKLVPMLNWKVSNSSAGSGFRFLA